VCFSAFAVCQRHTATEPVSLEAVEGKAETGRDGGGRALRPGEAAVDGPDTVVVAAQDSGVVV